MEVRRVLPTTGISDLFKEIDTRLRQQEGQPTGNVVVRETMSTIDPVTGVETIFGTLPDGSYGLKEWVNDVTPPDQPSAPALSVANGVITIAWDGLDAFGFQQPLDYDKTLVQMSNDGTTGWETVDEIRGNELSNITGQPYEEERYFRLISLDKNENASDPSLTVSGHVVPLTEVPEIAEAIAALDQKATDAQNKATDAQADAASASAAASTASSDAAAAAGVANGKGKVLIQNTAPGTADQNSVTLWIDTTGGANTPKKWNGSSWIVVTDKVATDAATVAGQAKTTADQAAVAANGAATQAGLAQDTADGKSTVWYLDAAPAGTSHREGDVWFDKLNGNKPMTWNGSAWISAQDAGIAAADSKAQAALTSANGKNTNYYQTAQPSGGTYLKGDLWFDTDDNYKMYTYPGTGSTWVLTQDSKSAITLANGKNTSTMSPTAPAVKVAGDVWIDTTNGNALKSWDGSAWVSAVDGAIAVADNKAVQADIKAGQAQLDVVTAQEAADQAKDDALAASNLAGTKGKVLVQSAAPGVEDRNTNTLWIDTTGGANTPKRWTTGTTWKTVTDKVAIDAAAAVVTAQNKADSAFNTATAAATAAGNAQTAADSKGRVWYQDTAPTGTGHNVNDTWYQSPGNVVHRWNGSAWVSIQDAAISTASSDISALQTSVSGKNKIVNSTANASGTTGYVSGDRWQKWSTLSSGGKLLASWRFTTSWIAESIDPVYIPQIDIGAGTFGDLNGSRMVAKSIQAESLVVGDYTNLLPNGNGDLGAGIGWGAGLSYSTSDVPSNVVGAFTSIAGQGTYTSPQPIYFNVEPDSDYGVEIWLKADKPDSKIYIDFMDQNGAYTTNTVTQLQNLPYNGGGSRIVNNYVVPTVWTKLYANLHTGVNTSKLRAGNFFFNHSSGTELTATISVAGLLVKRQVAGSLIVEGSITAESGVIGSIDLNVATVNQLDGIKIKARSISVAQLLVGSLDNLLSEPNFDGGLASWGGVSSFFSVDPTGSRNSKTALKITAINVLQRTWNTPGFSVEEKSVYRISAWVKSNLAQTANAAKLWVRTTNAAGVIADVFVDSSAALVANTWVKLTGVFEIPTGAITATVGISSEASMTSGNLLVDTISCVRAADGSLIVDGAITAGSAIIEAGAIGTAQIADLTVTTGKITDLAVTDAKISTINAGKITAGFIDAARIKAGTLTAALLLVSNSTNLIVDPSFYSDAPTTRRLTNSTGGVAGWTINAGTSTGQRSVTRTTGTTNDSFRAEPFVISAANRMNAIPVTAGQKYLFSVTTETDVSAGVRFNVYKWLADGTGVYSSASGFFTSSGKRSISYVYTVPAGVVAMYPSMACNVSGAIWTIYGDMFTGLQSGSTLIQDGAIKTTHMTAGTIDAGILTAGSIKAPMIAAKSITTDKLVITSSDNLVSEGDFAAGAVSWPAIITANPTGGRQTGTPCGQIICDSTQQGGYNTPEDIPTSGAESQYRMTAWVKSTVAIPANSVTIYIRTRNSAKTQSVVAVGQVPATAANVWVQITGYRKMLSSDLTMSFGIFAQTTLSTGTLSIDSVTVNRMGDGNLIVDGAIDGTTITGATIQTAGSGNRIVLSGNELTSTSNNTGGAAGDATFAITPTARRVKLPDLSYVDLPGIVFKSSNANATSFSSLSSATDFGSILMQSGGISNSDTSGLQLNWNGSWRLGTDNTNGNVGVVVTGEKASNGSGLARILAFDGPTTEGITPRGQVFVEGTLYINDINWDKSARGVLRRASNLNAGGITDTRATMLSTNFAGIAGRIVQITVHVHASASANATYASYGLSVGGVTARDYTKPYALGGYGDTTMFVVDVPITTTGTIAVILSGVVVANTSANVQWGASPASNPSVMVTVTDIGTL